MSASMFLGLLLGVGIGSFLYGFVSAALRDRQLSVWAKAKLAGWAQQFAWSVWNYAKRRAIRREQWLPGEAQAARNDDTPDQRRIAGNEARQVLDNRHFIAAWDALNAAIESQALACDTSTAEGVSKAANIVTAKQLLHGLKREFKRKLDDGYMAEIELEEIERKRRIPRLVR